MSKDGYGESGRVCGGHWQGMRINGIFKGGCLGREWKTSRRRWQHQISDRICGSITVHTSIRLTHYNSGCHSGNDNTWASPNVGLFFFRIVGRGRVMFLIASLPSHFSSTPAYPVLFPLLLPSTSQACALDYWILFWCNYSSVLKATTLQPNDVLRLWNTMTTMISLHPSPPTTPSQCNLEFNLNRFWTFQRYRPQTLYLPHQVAAYQLYLGWCRGVLCKRHIRYSSGDGTESQYMAALEVEMSLAEGELEGLGLGRYNEFPFVELTY